MLNWSWGDGEGMKILAEKIFVQKTFPYYFFFTEFTEIFWLSILSLYKKLTQLLKTQCLVDKATFSVWWYYHKMMAETSWPQHLISKQLSARKTSKLSVAYLSAAQNRKSCMHLLPPQKNLFDSQPVRLSRYLNFAWTNDKLVYNQRHITFIIHQTFKILKPV